MTVYDDENGDDDDDDDNDDSVNDDDDDVKRSDKLEDGWRINRARFHFLIPFLSSFISYNLIKKSGQGRMAGA